MGDLVLVASFISMLMIPCYVAARTVRGRRSPGDAGTAHGKAGGVYATAESFEDEGEAVLDRDEAVEVAAERAMHHGVDRRALAVQRSREIYFRTGGQPSLPDYGPLKSRESEAVPVFRKRKVG